MNPLQTKLSLCTLAGSTALMLAACAPEANGESKGKKVESDAI